tara:strand:- start:451 stop:591 length:141 start_codon:yes stop_codon:yes gene_type:complete
MTYFRLQYLAPDFIEQIENSLILADKAGTPIGLLTNAPKVVGTASH